MFIRGVGTAVAVPLSTPPTAAMNSVLDGIDLPISTFLTLKEPACRLFIRVREPSAFVEGARDMGVGKIRGTADVGVTGTEAVIGSGCSAIGGICGLDLEAK